VSGTKSANAATDNSDSGARRAGDVLGGTTNTEANSETQGNQEPGGNRLPMLAAEIRKAHADVHDAAKTAAQRAIDAGHALIEAKELVQHGQWLPWLRENCALAERTAQLYMKIAKSGLESATVADLGLSGAAKTILTIVDPYYDPFANCDQSDEHEWLIFILFLVSQHGWHIEGADYHTEYLLQKQFKNPDEWMGKEGESWRQQIGIDQHSRSVLRRWSAFLKENRERPRLDIEAELNGIREVHGPYVHSSRKPRRKGR
jgi:hypothetical protein